jgi:hypothetical protein
MTYRTTLGTMLMSATAILMAGCESDRSAMSEFFPRDSRTPHVFAAAHAEVGARHDATLQPHHFDGNELNSLGRQKLDDMTAGSSDHVTAVYLNLGENEQAEPRREAVVTYLRDRGLDEAGFRFITGTNAGVSSPAGGHLERMTRTESNGGSFPPGGFGATGLAPKK